MPSTKIFIVDDDEMYAKILGKHLMLNPGFEIEIFNSGKDCLNNLYKSPDIITLDYSMPEMTGREVLLKIAEKLPTAKVIIISAQNDIATAVDLLQEGAYDYMVKGPKTKEILWKKILNANETVGLQKKIKNLSSEVNTKYDYKKIIYGSSPQIVQTHALIDKALQTPIPVNIYGETGSGKELVAKSIHFNSSRSTEAFIAVNMAAIPSELVESELFGHEKGSFTGAIAEKIGKFELANGGTLFLDEIGEMNINLQAKLLRVLEEMQIFRVGGTTGIPLDFRLITATNKDLLKEVATEKFREDLYYRLQGIPIELPPLRERGEDIILLAEFFIKEYCKLNKLNEKLLSEASKQKLVMHSFPGNVRELKSLIELAIVMSNTDTVEPDHLIIKGKPESGKLLEKEQTLKEYNIHIIKSFLKKYDNKINLVANKLNIGKSTIYKMISDKEIDLE